jgi:RpiR family carbohydrate utilization transcriptional regulator
MRDDTGGLLAQIRASLAHISVAERKVAETVLVNIQAAISWSLADAAHVAGVSEPSVIRFCRRLGFSGYADFRIRLAQAIVLIEQENRPIPTDATDPIKAAIADVCNKSIAAIGDLMLDVDSAVIARAVAILAGARRIDIYGHGGSGYLAGETQMRFAHLGIASSAYSDPALQMFTSLSLVPGDSVLALSFSGVTTHLIPNLEIARNRGAKVVSLCPTGSPIAQASDVNISVNAYRQKEPVKFLPSERVTMSVMLDAIVGLVSDRLGR